MGNHWGELKEAHMSIGPGPCVRACACVGVDKNGRCRDSVSCTDASVRGRPSTGHCAEVTSAVTETASNRVRTPALCERPGLDTHRRFRDSGSCADEHVIAVVRVQRIALLLQARRMENGLGQWTAVTSVSEICAATTKFRQCTSAQQVLNKLRERMDGNETRSHADSCAGL